LWPRRCSPSRRRAGVRLAEYPAVATGVPKAIPRAPPAAGWGGVKPRLILPAESQVARPIELPADGWTSGWNSRAWAPRPEWSRAPWRLVAHPNRWPGLWQIYRA